jgi:hypothetical protein
MERRAVSFAALNSLRPLFVVGASVPLVVLGFGVQGAIVGTALGTLVACTVCIAMSRRSYALAFSVYDTRQIITRGAKVVIPVICLFIVHSADVVVIGQYASAQAAGLYRVASRFGSVPSYFASAFLMAWAPLELGVLFQATYRAHGITRVRSTLLTYYLVAGLLIVLALDVGANALVILVGPDYRAAAPLIPVIGLSFVIYGLFIVVARAIPVRKRLFWYAAMSLLSAAVYIGAATVTVPWLGAYGVPAAMSFGLMVSILIWVFLLEPRSAEPFPWEWRRIGALLAATAAAVAIQVVGGRLWPDAGPLVILAVVAAFLAVSVRLGVIPRAHLRPLARLTSAMVRSRVGGGDPLTRLEGLSASERGLAAALIRDAVPAAVLADREHRDENQVLHEFVSALRRLSALSPDEVDRDREIGLYLLSPEPEAQRDVIGRELIEEGVDGLGLLVLDETVRRLRAAPESAWAGQRESARDAALAAVPMGDLRRLAGVVAELPMHTRTAVVSVLRDGVTPERAGAAVGLPGEVVAARVVRALRAQGELGRGRPEDLLVGQTLLGQRRARRSTPQARAIGHVLDAVRAAPRRQWRRAGLGPRDVPPAIAPPVDAGARRAASPTVGLAGELRSSPVA